MHVRGDQWPVFLYADLAYDAEDPWNGLMRSQLLVSVRLRHLTCSCFYSPQRTQGFKHVFTSPSSVEEEEPRATKSGNARIHGMTRVTGASLAYVATQVVFILLISTTTADDFKGSLCSLLLQHLLTHGFCHRFRNILQ
jgi:hypothetical protein